MTVETKENSVTVKYGENRLDRFIVNLTEDGDLVIYFEESISLLPLAANSIKIRPLRNRTKARARI